MATPHELIPKWASAGLTGKGPSPEEGRGRWPGVDGEPLMVPRCLASRAGNWEGALAGEGAEASNMEGDARWTGELEPEGSPAGGKTRESSPGLLRSKNPIGLRKLRLIGELQSASIIVYITLETMAQMRTSTHPPCSRPNANAKQMQGKATRSRAKHRSM